MLISVKKCGVSKELFIFRVAELAVKAFEGHCTVPNVTFLVVKQLKHYIKTYKSAGNIYKDLIDIFYML